MSQATVHRYTLIAAGKLSILIIPLRLQGREYRSQGLFLDSLADAQPMFVPKHQLQTRQHVAFAFTHQSKTRSSSTHGFPAIAAAGKTPESTSRSGPPPQSFFASSVASQHRASSSPTSAFAQHMGTTRKVLICRGSITRDPQPRKMDWPDAYVNHPFCSWQ